MMNLKLVTSGNRRNVFLIGQYAIKIPTHKSFVEFTLGLIENLHERYWYSADGRKHSFIKQIQTYPQHAGIHWADRFGFILIQERLDCNYDNHPSFKIDYQKLYEKYHKEYKDLKPQNTGYRGDELVILDYGYFDCLSAAYLGT